MPLLSSPSTTADRDTDAFRGNFYLNGVSEEASSLDDLARRSDLIVVGSVTSLQESRSWVVHPSLGADGVALYAMTELRVEEVVSAKDPADTRGPIVLELFVPVPTRFLQVAAAAPASERAVFFLIHTPDNPKTYSFAVLNSSYFRDAGRVLLPVGAESDWLGTLQSQTFDGLVDELRRISG